MAGMSRQRTNGKASEGTDAEEGEEDEDAGSTGTAFDRPTFTPTGPPHPDDPTLLRFTEFEGYLKTFRSDPVSGDLILTISIRPDQKYQAFMMTDFMLYRYKFDVYKAPAKIRRKKADVDADA